MNGIGRFLSKREKHGSHGSHGSRHHERHREILKDKASTGQQTPSQAAAHYNSLFSAAEQDPHDKDEDKKVTALRQKILRTGIGDLREPQIRYALRSKVANGDPDRAYDFLMMMEDSAEGILREYNPNVKLLGAENRSGVTCYLDALLFAMFARLDSFEAILYNSFDDEPRWKLSTILRLWVNMLRSGMLITTDITKQLQDALAECGWKEAADLCQQDASEAFTVVTEKLELPLLTLKMDIYHTGREDSNDDHKFINERLLEVAIPQNTAAGNPVTLEHCLETYFNNRIEVRRYLERRSTINSLRSMDANGVSTHIEEVDSCGSSPSRSISRSTDPSSPMSPGTPSIRPARHRAPSILQERFIPEDSSMPSEIIDWNDETKGRGRSRKGSIRKEVMMPAWQFFSLIPWYTDSAPKDDAQVAAHFSSKRPMLGLCLKRYSFLPTGKAIRLDTPIDIPIEIGLPHFIKDDRMDEEAPIYGNFKLSLQSVVCHRGESVGSGHYISLVRGTAANAINKDGSGQPEDASNPKNGSWMRFDDLAKERITLVDIEKALKMESPYLLFYQILPVDGDPGHIIDDDRPPSYAESMKDSSSLKDSGASGLSTASLATDTTSGSERPSFEIADHEDHRGRFSVHGERRPSIACTDSSARSSEGGLRPETATNERTSTETPRAGTTPIPSRRSSIFRKSRSNPGSRSGSRSRSTGEGRFSFNMSRLTSQISRERLNTIESVRSDGAAAPSKVTVTPATPAVGEKPMALPQHASTVPFSRSPDKSSHKDARRDKSKNRLSKYTDGKGKDREYKPDRECVLM